jgi:hypothetical protein
MEPDAELLPISWQSLPVCGKFSLSVTFFRLISTTQNSTQLTAKGEHIIEELNAVWKSGDMNEVSSLELDLVVNKVTHAILNPGKA